MGFLKPKGVPVTVAGRELEISFNMNVVETIYDKFGSLNDFQKSLKGQGERGSLQTTIWILSVMINDAIEEQNETGKEKIETLSEKQLGRLLTPKDFVALRDSLLKAWVDGMPADEDEEASDEAEAENPAEDPEDETEKN